VRGETKKKIDWTQFRQRPQVTIQEARTVEDRVGVELAMARHPHIVAKQRARVVAEDFLFEPADLGDIQEPAKRGVTLSLEIGRYGHPLPPKLA
jgi:hypothetical protein